MPDNATVVMQMSKPQITYVGGNFLNSQNLYDPSITMTSQQNNSQVFSWKINYSFLKTFQFDDAVINFGTVVNSGLVAASNDTLSSIMLTFRSVLISAPSDQANGSQYVNQTNSFLFFFNEILFFFPSGLLLVLNITMFQKYGLVKHYSSFLISRVFVEMIFQIFLILDVFDLGRNRNIFVRCGQ